jgi:hypothetical protein
MPRCQLTSKMKQPTGRQTSQGLNPCVIYFFEALKIPRKFSEFAMQKRHAFKPNQRSERKHLATVLD